MKCYLILALLLLSIYIKSDTPCEQITPVAPTDCENGISEKMAAESGKICKRESSDHGKIRSGG